MKTTVVTEEEIEEIADKLREIWEEISLANSDYDFDDKNEQKLFVSALGLSETHIGDILAEIEGIQERFTPNDSGSSDPPDQRDLQIDQRRLLAGSKYALLAALNSLDGVRGHDTTSPLDNNKTEIPISHSELSTMRSLLKGAIELHGTDLNSNYVQLALSELLKFLREIYEKLKTLAAVAVAGSILYSLVKLFENAVHALGTLLTGVQFIVG